MNLGCTAKKIQFKDGTRSFQKKTISNKMSMRMLRVEEETKPKFSINFARPPPLLSTSRVYLHKLIMSGDNDESAGRSPWHHRHTTTGRKPSRFFSHSRFSFFFSFFNFLSSIEPSFLPAFLALFECISNWINLTGISLSYSTRVPWIRPIQLMDRDWNAYCT